MTTEELHLFLQNPEMTGENLVPAHSDHFFYENEKDLIKGEDMPLKQSLNGVWKFKYSKNLFKRPKDFYKEGFDVSEFDDILVPCHIEMQGYDRKHYTNMNYPWDGRENLMPPEISRDDAPVGSYVLDFKVDKNLKNKPLFISFQGVETAFRLFCNGEYVGFSEDSFTPADFELTKFIKSGRNRICAEVYKRSSASWLEDQDMWRFFGIFREVFLYAYPSLHVKDMCVQAVLDENYEKGILDVACKTYGPVKRASLELFTEDGNRAFEFPMEVTPNSLKLHTEGLFVNTWSAEDPFLYDLRISLKDETDSVKEISTCKIGFRTFELKNNLMLINGKRIVFKGVDRHEFSALNGRCCTKEEMLWDIKTFKKNNINAVRTSHYPNQSMWYRLCDEYGIYMIDETNLETHGTWHREECRKNDMVVPGSKPEWKKAVIERAEHMLMRDRNHPAVLIWSLGNESYGGDNFVAMHDFLKEKDSTRLVHYEGVVNYRASDAATDMETRMYAKPQEIREYLSNNPKKPYLSCEYMHAMGNSLGGMKLYTDLEDEFEMYQGGFIWDYLDQALWQRHGDKMRLAYGGDFGDRTTEYCFCTDGLVFANRVESPKCMEAKNLYANVHLQATDKEILIENRNLFIDLSRYYFVYTVSENGKIIYTKTFTDINLRPGERASYLVEPEDELKPDADYVFRIKMCEKNETKWAKAGFMVAFNESVKFARVNPVLLTKDNTAKEFKHVGTFVCNRGADTDDYSLLFSDVRKGVGGLVSLRDKEKEIVTMPPKPSYFRAYTDNDKGFRLGEKAHFWHMLSLYQGASLDYFENKGEYVEAKYSYTAPESEEIISEIVYKAYPDKRLEVKAKYLGKENRPILPLFGFEMKLDKEYDNVEYFGKGPVENYIDRSNGVYTDIFKEKVEDNLTPYLIPQEAGNRTGVRYAKVTNDEGHGLLFASLEGTFELGFLPYSAYEMENALHLDELPLRNYTWIRINAAQMGVGGDDSWGASVQKEFLLDSSKDYEVSFEVRII